MSLVSLVTVYGLMVEGVKLTGRVKTTSMHVTGTVHANTLATLALLQHYNSNNLYQRPWVRLPAAPPSFPALSVMPYD